MVGKRATEKVQKMDLANCAFGPFESLSKRDQWKVVKVTRRSGVKTNDLATNQLMILACRFYCSSQSRLLVQNTAYRRTSSSPGTDAVPELVYKGLHQKLRITVKYWWSLSGLHHFSLDSRAPIPSLCQDFDELHTCIGPWNWTPCTTKTSPYTGRRVRRSFLGFQRCTTKSSVLRSFTNYGKE